MSEPGFKAWGIGLGRTGTSSLCDAFRLLGFKRVYHNPSFSHLLRADAAADNGCVLYYKFLDYKYRGSKFILTVRDRESWLESMRFIHAHSRELSRENDPQILRRMLLYECVDFDRDRYIEAYERYHADVRRYFRQRPHDLLEMNMIDGDGWDELCAFLDLPIPDVPFPHANTRSEWRRAGGPPARPRAQASSRPRPPPQKRQEQAAPGPAAAPTGQTERVDPERLIYSCVMEPSPGGMHQTQALVWTLLDLARVPAPQIVVHALEGGDETPLGALSELGVRLVRMAPAAAPTPPFLRQLGSAELSEADVVVLLNSETVVSGDLAPAASARCIRACQDDRQILPPELLQQISAGAGFGSGRPDWPVPAAGGLYFLPAAALAALATEWPRRARWLIEHADLLGNHRSRVCQIAFGLACQARGLTVEPLPPAMNYPLHDPESEPDLTPLVLFHRGKLSASGLLATIRKPQVNAAVLKVNRVIGRRLRQCFDNRRFWDFRYATASDLGSGIGSRGTNLNYKRRLLQEQLTELQGASVLDVGCGDLEATRELPVTAYTGVDVSDEATKLAQDKRPDWTFLSGDARFVATEPHDVVICLDVLIHQPTRIDYEGLLSRLIALARERLLVSGYNQPPWHDSPITFYFEPLSQTLSRLAPGAKLTIVGGYRDTTVLRVDLKPAAVRRKGQQRVETPFGVFFSHRDDLVTKQLHEFGAHTRNELAMLRSFVREGDVIIDVGAHIGTFAIPLARAAGPSARVVAVEPDARSVALLRKNVAANGLDDNVEIVTALVGDQPGRFRKIIEPGNTGATYFIGDDGGQQQHVVSLDRLWRRHAGGKPVAIVKIDTEGMELPVLRSGRKLLEQCRPLLYLEVHRRHLQRHGFRLEELEELLTSRRYAFFRNRGPRNSGDDFFEIKALASLADGGVFFDCLAVPKERAKRLIGRPRQAP